MVLNDGVIYELIIFYISGLCVRTRVRVRVDDSVVLFMFQKLMQGL
jgi:hypothetical protein